MADEGRTNEYGRRIATDANRGGRAARADASGYREEGVPNIRTHEPTAMQVFFAWEKIRVGYNVLISVGILVLLGRGAPVRISQAIWIYVLANVAFCVGPVMENYLRWVGIPRWLFRAVSAIAVTASFIMWCLMRNLG